MRGLSLLLLCSCWPSGLDLTPGDDAGEGDFGTHPSGGDNGSDDGTGGSDGAGTDGGDGGGGTVPLPDSALSPARQLARVSIALRGIPPSADDFAAIEADPTRLASFVDAYLYDPKFLETIKDAYAERLLLRQDQVIPLSDDAGMGAYSKSEAFTMFESPLQLIAHVIDDDRPFTQIVSTSDLWVNEPMSIAVGGTWHAGGDEWQVSEDGWGDGRPEAGLLSNSILWIRHQSMGNNDQRGRANLVADALLCEAFTDRDVDIDGTIDLSSEDAILDAVFTNENCLACHQALEPLASNFWGYKRAYNAISISAAFQSGCTSDGDSCYPVTEYNADDVDVWWYKDLRAPGYYGTGVTGGLAELGGRIADDPRFAQCVVRTVYGYLAQMDRSAVPLETVASYQKVLEDSDFNVRTLTKAIVTSPEFLLDGNGSDGTVGLLSMRPEAVGRTMESLTGFVWRASHDDAGCNGFDCYGTVDLANNDNYGFRVLMGGVDGRYVTTPVWDTTPTRVLAVDALVSEAAAWVVAKDLQEPDLSRRLLLTELVDPVEDPRSQLAALYFRFYGEHVDADDPTLDPIVSLMNETTGRTATELWTLAVAAMLQDPELLFY